LLAVTLCFGCSTKADPPNFVFVLVDDLGYMDVGAFNDNTFYETPNIDRLAASGVRFTSAYAASPVCSPTRASIMTGKNPARLKTTDWFGAPQPETAADHSTGRKPLLPAAYIEQLPHDEVTIAEALGDAGYKTFFAGKWHLGHEGSYPEDHGFDVNKGGWERGGPYGGGRYFSPYGNPRLEDGPTGEHLPARLASETAEFIRQAGDEPFFAYLSFYSVHTPLMARADLEAKYELKAAGAPPVAWGSEGDRKVRLVQNHAVYASMIEAMDEAVGVVLEAIEASGHVDDTVVIFMSDNGGLSTSEGHPTSNIPLRAGKGWLYEGGIREPMIVRWPDLAMAGTSSDEVVISTDFYPTMLEMAGLSARPEQHVDGVSFVQVLESVGSAAPQSLERDAVHWHYPHYGNQGGSPGSAIRSGDWKLIRHYENDEIELYDLATDIGETRDLALRNEEVASTLADKLDAWLLSVDARFPTPNPAAEDNR
jgi:arylsulfatase A-like enzyme